MSEYIFPQSDTLAESYPKLQEELKRQNEEDKRLQREITANKADIEKKLEQHKTSDDHTADKIRYDGKIPKDNVKDALDETDTRIDNIVSQGGNDNTEVVDARHSTTKDKTYNTLKGRLEDGEQDIEKLKTDTNVAESVTETSYNSVISVPDSAINGQISGVVRGLTATNLIENGDFSADFNNWSDGSISDGKLVKTFSADTSQNLLFYKKPRTINEKYYSKLEFKIISGSIGRIRFLTGGVSREIDVPELNQLVVVSDAQTSVSEGGSSIQLTLRDISAGTQIEIYNAFSINLTQTFGAGNEPTKEECDQIFANYFDGTKSTIGSARISSADDTGEVKDRAYVTAVKDNKIVDLMSHEGVHDEIDLEKRVLIKRVGVDETGQTYQLAEPEIIPVRWTGLQAYEGGTIYVDTVIPELGFYCDNGLESHYPEHPIKEVDTLYRVDKETGYKEPLDVSKCEIREDRLSFTHPDLVDGDLCDWDYVPMTESTRPETTFEFPTNLKASVNSLLDAEKTNKKEHNIFKARLDNHDRDIERIDDDIESIDADIKNVQSDIDAHEQDSNNPHSVTPDQIGAETPSGAQAKVDTHRRERVRHLNGSYGDKIIVALNPWVNKQHVYKGQLHAHTTNSDGKNTPTEIMTAYRDAGFDFCAISDHNKYTPDPNVSGILHIPAVEESANEGHILAVGVTESSPHKIGQLIVNDVNDRGGMTGIAHSNLPTIPYNLNNMPKDYSLFEIYNGWGTNPYAEDKYDVTLTEGRTSWAIAVDDNHDITTRFAQGWIMVNADSLTKNDILSSIRNGNFYATQGALISDISIDENNLVTVVVPSQSTIKWIIKNGEIIKTSTNATVDTYQISGDERYVRIEIVRDSDGKKAWSQPIQVMQLRDFRDSKVQENWIPVTSFSDGFEPINDPTFPNPEFYKDNFGNVHLRGRFKGIYDSRVAFILPEGYRPEKTLHFACASGGFTFTAIRIDSNGRVTVFYKWRLSDDPADMPPYIDVSGIIFQAAQ